MFGMSKGPEPAKRKAKQAASPSADAEDEPGTAQTTLSMTSAQRAKLERLGGAKWLIAQIDQAKAPPR